MLVRITKIGGNKMGIRYEDECCGCATESYPCLGSACPNRNVPVYFCDTCKEEFEKEELQEIDGKHYCKECIERTE